MRFGQEYPRQQGTKQLMAGLDVPDIDGLGVGGVRISGSPSSSTVSATSLLLPSTSSGNSGFPTRSDTSSWLESGVAVSLVG